MPDGAIPVYTISILDFILARSAFCRFVTYVTVLVGTGTQHLEVRNLDFNF